MTSRTAYGDLITQTATRYSLDANLLEAQVLIESAGDPWAFRYEPHFFDRYIEDNPTVSGHAYGPLAACSYGLLQIMLETALEIGYVDAPEELFDPAMGLDWGARYFRSCLDWAHGNYPKAFAAYNEGKRLAALGPPFGDQAYINRIYAAVAA